MSTTSSETAGQAAAAPTYLARPASAVIAALFCGYLAVGLPFQKASMMMDIIFLLCAFALAYMSWSAYREQT